MAEPRSSQTEELAVKAAVGKSRKLAARVPRLILEARRVATTVVHGLHGRRRAGPGENFWQYRRFTNGEPAQNVDWRRSARDDHLYVREREWEASHTIWLWPDLSPSMDFSSDMTEWTKLDRALVIAFAMAEVFVQGGERVGIPDLMRPTSSRNIIEKMAQNFIHDMDAKPSLPPNFAPAPFSEVLLLSDFWSPIPDFRRIIGQLAANGARGHVVQVVDPAEESFPYSGRIEFIESEGLGSITAGRAEAWRKDYQALLANHRAALRAECEQVGWSFTVHRTDRGPTELLFAIHARMEAGAHTLVKKQSAVAIGLGRARMIPGLPLAFAQPLLLLGLLSLPILFWLLRLVPPRPRQFEFPPARLLFEIAPKEETPARTPWWLTLLRLTLAALIIIAAAGPLWNPPVAGVDRSAPLGILIDDSYAAAATWDARIRTADEMIGRAEADNRGVALIPLSDTARDVSMQPPGAARVRLKQLRPQPYALDRMAALPPIERFLTATPNVELVWLADGLDHGRGADFVAALKQLTERRALTIVAGGVVPPLALAAAENTASGLTVKVLRGSTGGSNDGIARAIDLKGLPLGDANYSFKSGERETDATFDLPVEIRNDVARIEIVSERSAGAVQLLDKRWRRRTIGVISGSSSDTAQPLLGSTFYLSRALNPFADVRVLDAGSPAEGVTRFLDQRLPLLVLADVGKVTGDAHGRLLSWIENGGVLVRFAGPRLAAASDDDLVPVKLRRGGRILGGALSWEQPQQLTAFSREGPFNGMPVPNDVTVTRQVLADPDAELNDRTWATLGDGTPLVTAQKRGKGLVVLFHVTSDTRWSDLPLSGAFVDMLKRLVSLAGSSPATDSEQTAARQAVPASRTLDGFGAFEPPPATARPVPAGYASRASADHPPGFYGPPEGLVAVNTLAPADRLTPLDTSTLTNAVREIYRLAEPQDLRGPIFLLALLLLLIDALVVFFLAGGFSRLVRRRAVAAGLTLIIAGSLALAPQSSRAQTSIANQQANAVDEFALKSSTQTRLAYVVTGDAEADAVSKSGLQGLTLFLAQRTALEAGDPVGVDPGRDELSFFPVIYWPIVPGIPKPSAQTLARVDAYMKQGGTVVFDTRDAGSTVPNDPSSPGTAALREILTSLDIPELEPIPRDHVLTKTFFLMKDFPGRFTDGQLWVEALPANPDEGEGSRPARGGDGVSSVLITSNDLAGAWAVRPDGQPMLPLTPGEPRQREFAFRAGVNIVMYALTGNYKADQVHVPALLERLGQ